MRDMHKKCAKLTVELSIMIAILVVVIMSVLGMFGNGIKNVVANSGFAKSALNQEVVENKTSWDTYANTQENIAVTGVQGIQFNPKNPEEWINATFATLLNKEPADLSDIDLEALARALVMGDRAGMENLDDFRVKCENLGIELNNFTRRISYTNKNGKIKSMKYDEIAYSRNNDNAEIYHHIYTNPFN